MIHDCCCGRWAPAATNQSHRVEVQVAIVAHGIGRKGRVHFRGSSKQIPRVLVGRFIEQFLADKVLREFLLESLAP